MESPRAYPQASQGGQQQGAGLEAADGPSHLEIQCLVTLLTESMEAMASELRKYISGAASGPLPRAPLVPQPSQSSYSQMGSSENTHLGFIWGWALQVQAQFVSG